MWPPRWYHCPVPGDAAVPGPCFLADRALWLPPWPSSSSSTASKPLVWQARSFCSNSSIVAWKGKISRPERSYFTTEEEQDPEGQWRKLKCLTLKKKVPERS